MNLLSYLWHAPLLVQAVMLGLLALSCASWSLIVLLGRPIYHTQTQAEQLLQSFWQAQCLDRFYQDQRKKTSHLASQVMVMAFETYQRQSSIEQMLRRMDIAKEHWFQQKEVGLHWLATISTISPYIGLLGTVVGLIHAFRGLADAKQVSIAFIAPGIAEALMTTALGLLVAIPAAVAYNRLTCGMNHLDDHLETLKKSLTFTLHTHEKTPTT